MYNFIEDLLNNKIDIIPAWMIEQIEKENEELSQKENRIHIEISHPISQKNEDETFEDEEIIISMV